MFTQFSFQCIFIAIKIALGQDRTVLQSIQYQSQCQKHIHQDYITALCSSVLCTTVFLASPRLTLYIPHTKTAGRDVKNLYIALKSTNIQYFPSQGNTDVQAGLNDMWKRHQSPCIHTVWQDNLGQLLGSVTMVMSLTLPSYKHYLSLYDLFKTSVQVATKTVSPPFPFPFPFPLQRPWKTRKTFLPLTETGSLRLIFLCWRRVLWWDFV